MLLFNLFVRRRNFIKFYFNTSNVTIQRENIVNINKELLDFNTSNVTIQL